MKERKIKNVESTSIGKITGKNDDDIYIGNNFAAVIDGVSSKSKIDSGEKSRTIGRIITEAIRKIDRPTAPEYAKTLEMEEFIQYINMYIKRYCDEIKYPLSEKPLEATGAIYSKYHNQIWIVGDCRAVYDGNVIENELKIDEVYMKIRAEVIRTLLRLGYTEQELFSKDIAKEMITNSQKIKEYIKDEKEEQRIISYMQDVMMETLLSCGFTLEDIREQNLLEKYSNPKKLQQYLKNNPNVGQFGYSVFNGIYTETKNCVKKDLPQEVKRIVLSSDGIPLNTLKKSKDVGQMIRRIRRLAASDLLSINENKAVRSATLQSDKNYALDDASAIIIEIEYINERDEER